MESLIELMDNPGLPDVLVQCMAWILGEYGYLSESLSKEEIIDKLCTLATKNFNDLITRGYVLSALFKLVAQTGSCPTKVTTLVTLYADSKNLDISQVMMNLSKFPVQESSCVRSFQPISVAESLRL